MEKQADQALKDHFSSSFRVISFAAFVMAFFIILSKNDLCNGIFPPVKKPEI